MPALEIAEVQSGPLKWNGSRRGSKSGPVGPSVSVLVLHCRPGRSRGPGRLTPKVGAGDHPGDDAQPAPQRLPLLGGVRRRPAIGRWVPFVGASHPAHPASGRRCVRSSVSGRDVERNYLRAYSHERPCKTSGERSLLRCRWGVQRNEVSGKIQVGPFRS